MHLSLLSLDRQAYTVMLSRLTRVGNAPRSINVSLALPDARHLLAGNLRQRLGRIEISLTDKLDGHTVRSCRVTRERVGTLAEGPQATER